MEQKLTHPEEITHTHTHTHTTKKIILMKVEKTKTAFK
jgi:hypothetical protein